ncbi:unnamed protein product, partial [Hapterophycus canaliculatus]
ASVDTLCRSFLTCRRLPKKTEIVVYDLIRFRCSRRRSFVDCTGRDSSSVEGFCTAGRKWEGRNSRLPSDRSSSWFGPTRLACGCGVAQCCKGLQRKKRGKKMGLALPPERCRSTN